MKEKKNERCLRSCLLLGLAILLVGCGVSTEGTSVLQMPAESGSRTASGENTESEAADAAGDADLGADQPTGGRCGGSFSRRIPGDAEAADEQPADHFR